MQRSRLLVLTYHGVVAEDHPGDYRFRSTVSRRDFRTQLETVGKLLSPISGSDLIDTLDGRRSLPRNAVLITFDDGYRNNLTHAAPELERAGIPAVFFVSTGYIGSDRVLWPLEIKLRLQDWDGDPLPLPGGLEVPSDMDRGSRTAQILKISDLCKHLSDAERRRYLSQLRARPWSCPLDPEVYAFMSWDEVRDLRGRGFDIGSHTVEHPILSRLDSDELTIELAASKRAIEAKLGTDCPWLAYPNGGRADFSADVVAQAESAGYRCAFTQLPGFNSPLEVPFELCRMDVPGHVHPAVFHSRLSGLFMLAGG